jgi:transcription elongation factor Elf1
MSDLQDCYFCGARAPEIQLHEKRVMEAGNIEGERGVYTMICEICGAKIEYDSEEELVACWNYIERAK